MRVLIRETLETAVINIYGTDGKQHSKDFFEKYFSNAEGAYPTLDEEREEYGTDAEWTIIRKQDFERFAEIVPALQKAIDDVQDRITKGSRRDEYTFNSDCFLI